MTTTSWPAPQRQRATPSPHAQGAGRRRLRRVLRRSRRPLAALLLACATGLVAMALAPRDGAVDGVQVLVATDDLPAGSPVAAGSRAATLPPAAVPSGALAPADLGATDARLAAPVRRGEVITDVRLSGGDVLASLAPGQVAVPVAVTSPLPDGLVVPGARVAVLAASPEGPRVPSEGDDEGVTPSGVLVRSATVLVVSSDPLTTGLLASGSGGTSVVLALDDDDAARVAAATANGGVVLARAA